MNTKGSNAGHHAGTETERPPMRCNEWLALKITNGVGNMWTAYVFAALALISLPAAIASHDALVIVSWLAQTFLQLVLLPIIMVGQNVANQHHERQHKAHRENAAKLNTILSMIERDGPPKTR